MHVGHQRSDELRRLWNGPRPDERPWPMDDAFAVDCSGDADAVLGRATAVLGVVLEQDPADWPSDERWRELLPAWFLEPCRGGPAAPADAWPIECFTLGFRHEDRSWWWFDATVDSADLIRVRVEIDDARSAGAT